MTCELYLTGGLFVRDELTFIEGAKVAAIRIFPEADKDQFEIAFAVSELSVTTAVSR